MSYASSRMSLYDIQKDLLLHMKDLSIISDLNVSEEDYRYLATKVKMLFQFANDNTVVDDYKLSIVVYWVYSMVYWDKKNLDVVEMDLLFKGLPQYKQKYYLSVCMEAFDEYGICCYDAKAETLKSYSHTVIARHAGIPKEDMQQVFTILSKYVECNIVQDLVEAVIREVPDRTKAILCCMDPLCCQKTILLYRNAMIDALKGTESREVLQRRYSSLSKDYLNGMLNWCEQLEERQSKIIL